MIERFNFFDIYAYLLPGVAFLGLIWLPFGIVGGHWPPADLSSALLWLVAAYIVGHVLYHPASEALPTESKGQYATPPGAPRWRAKPSHPSDFVLDAGELTYPKKFKEELQTVINERFKDAAEVNVGFDWDNAADEQKKKDESKQRNLAFLLCRSALVTGKVASYGEQFQGLYELLRSLTVVCVVCFFYHVGWALAVWKTPASQFVAPLAALAVLAIVGAAILDKWGAKVIAKRLAAWMTIGLLTLALLLCPFFLRCLLDPAKAGGSCSKVLLLTTIALTDAFVGWRWSSAYKPFAWQFATAIYRDFYAYAKGQGKAASNES